jgi:hypothetical protein
MFNGALLVHVIQTAYRATAPGCSGVVAYQANERRFNLSDAIKELVASGLDTAERKSAKRKQLATGN